MRVYITGACGQIGSHLAEHLLARGDMVHGIDNFATGKRENLRDHENLTLTIGSIADRELVEKTISEFRPDVIVHCAASYKDPDDYFTDSQTNCVGAANLITSAKANGIQRFIYFQTSLCYGIKPSESPIRVDHPLNPGASSYAITKTVAEQFLQISGLDYVSFRLANVIGPRNVSGPLPIFFDRLSQGKRCFVTTARRDFVFVKDLIPAVVKAIDGTGHGIYHFSSGSDVTIKELYDAVVSAMKIAPYPEPEIRELGPDDAPFILLDPSRTFAEFGDFTFTPLGEIARAAVDYYSEHGVSGGFTHLRLDVEKEKLAAST